MSMRVLHVAAEVFPLVKTGGLADVVAALPVAQAEQGADVRLLLPGLPPVLDAVQGARTVIDIGACFGACACACCWRACRAAELPVYVVDAPYLYRRGGSPYQDSQGEEWPDNLQRFALLGWVAAHLAADDADPQWVPDIVHAHDWHAAMACAFMAEHPPTRGGSVFTVHNLAFQGLFPMHDWAMLGLASRLMSPAGLEFHGQLSFMKAGLKFADRVTTVSPTYAREIATHEFGCGLDGVIRGRGADVTGILNGIDGAIWNPATDAAIAARYDAERLAGKAQCKRALQAELGLDADDRRAAAHGGQPADGAEGAGPGAGGLARTGARRACSSRCRAPASRRWKRPSAWRSRRTRGVCTCTSATTRRVRTGWWPAADVIAVPSRFEPCGLTQMYGLRYGTLPVVRRVGGLADTVSDMRRAARRHRLRLRRRHAAGTGAGRAACLAPARRHAGLAGRHGARDGRAAVVGAAGPRLPGALRAGPGSAAGLTAGDGVPRWHAACGTGADAGRRRGRPLTRHLRHARQHLPPVPRLRHRAGRRPPRRPRTGPGRTSSTWRCLAAALPRCCRAGSDVPSRQRIDVRGQLVIPGMIDTHAHVFQHVTGRFGLEADLCGVRSGVTTLIDQGGPSCMTLPAFREFVVKPKAHARVRVPLGLPRGRAGRATTTRSCTGPTASTCRPR